MNQKAVFQARLQRMASHSGNTNATLHIGMSDQLERAAFNRRAIAAGPAAPKEPSSAPLHLGLAIVSGGMGWAWAHWLRVTMMPATDPLVALLADLSLGVTALLLLRAILGLHGKAILVLQLLGMSAGILFLHNAVHQWPELFARVFPAPWVSSVLTDTLPMSVNLSAFAI